MAVAQTFRITRMSLTGGVKVAVAPPVTCRKPSIGNATADDLQVHTTDDNDTEYLVVPAGYERDFPVLTGQLLHPNVTACWLKPIASGTIVILWLI